MAIRHLILRLFYNFLWVLGISVSLKNNRVRGWYGEWKAGSYLKGKDFLLIHKNWHSPLDARREIDLIAKDQECIVFIEVRARAKNSLNSGYYSINQKKRQSLLSACKDFLRLNYDNSANYRFDVIEVDLDQTNGNVLHHENVSLFP